MRRFEYQKMAFVDLIELGRNAPPNEASEMEALKHFGDTGWELVSILDNKSQSNVMYYFKRELI